MDFSHVNTDLWNFMIQIGILCGILLLANTIRRKTPGLNKLLMPTAVIAGFIALFLRVFNIFDIQVNVMEVVTYHTIAIGYIALTLIIPKREASASKVLIGSKTGALIVSTYLIQAIFGLIISIALVYTVRPDLFMASGVLLPMGYGQGPGQANNLGSAYESMGFYGGQSFALSIAAMGFLVACTVGVIYLNFLKRKNLITRRSFDPNAQEIPTIEEFEDKNEIPISESMDRFSVQVALVLFVYFAMWAICRFFTNILLNADSNLARSIIFVLWGFNFLFGALLASAVRGIIKLLRKKGLMNRQYINNYLLGRIGGFSFDIMIIAGICSINFEKLSGLWLPFILMCIVGAIITFFFLHWICKKLYPTYFYEAFLCLFGTLTGIISSGILLLREADPRFETPIVSDMILGVTFAAGLGFPMLILCGLAPQSTEMLFIVFGIFIAYFLLLLLYMLKFKGKKI